MTDKEKFCTLVQGLVDTFKISRHQDNELRFIYFSFFHLPIVKESIKVLTNGLDEQLKDEFRYYMFHGFLNPPGKDVITTPEELYDYFLIETGYSHH